MLVFAFPHAMVQAQELIQSDYHRMKDLQADERGAIAVRTNAYDTSILTELARGEDIVVAAALGWRLDSRRHSTL